jgi:HlyD family secretion protein
MSRWILAIVVIVLIIAAVFWARSLQAVPVQAASVTRGELRTYVEERAKTKLGHTYHITMPLAGRIEPIDLVEGTVVAAGQVIARMDAAELETRVVQAAARVARLDAEIVKNADTRLEDRAHEEAMAMLESIDRSVEAAEEETKASQAQVDFAREDLVRVQAMSERGATTETELDETELAKIHAEVDYRKDILTLRSIEAIRSAMRIWPRTIRQYVDKKELQRAVLEQQRQEAQAELDQARRDRQRALITSPVDGLVLARHVSNERVLAAGAALLEVGTLADLEVEVEVLTQDAANISIGDPVDIFGAAIGAEPIQGRVARIDPRGFTKVSSLGVEQQRVSVTVELAEDAAGSLQERGRSLGVDYRVHVKIYTDQVDEALLLPRTALFRGADGAWYAYVIENREARRQRVETGLSNSTTMQVTSGVSEGDRVIITPESSIDEGTRVQVLN